MVGPLERVLVCSPRMLAGTCLNALLRWQELGFHHAPDFAKAQLQHEAFVS